MLGAIVGVERIDGPQGRDRADFGFEIPPARPDRMTDATAGARDQARHLLNSSARCPDDADVSGWNDIGKTQRHTADDRRSAIRSHDEETPLARLALECRLVYDRHIVGENHDVKPKLHGLARF